MSWIKNVWLLVKIIFKSNLSIYNYMIQLKKLNFFALTFNWPESFQSWPKLTLKNKNVQEEKKIWTVKDEMNAKWEQAFSSQFIFLFSNNGLGTQSILPWFKSFSIVILVRFSVMAIWVVKFSREGYKIRQIFGRKPQLSKIGDHHFSASKKRKLKGKMILTKKWCP